MDSLEEYVINHSSCGMPRCEYVENDIEIDCDECQKRMIAEHDAQIRADERKKAEQDFQNSDYWNDYLAKVLADERANLLKEICEHERTMIDDDGKIHFVVKMIDVMKVFNKEYKNE